MRNDIRFRIASWGRALGIALLTMAAAVPNPGSASVTVMETSAQPEERLWAFRVFLDDREIGRHEFRIVQEGRQARAEIEARFEVKFLFVTAYRYRHTNVEIWRDGCLTRIESETDANGDRAAVSGDVGASGFELESSAGEAVIDSGCVQTFAYWNPSILDADTLLNAQTGEYVPVEVAELGRDTLQIEGLEVAARRYQIRMEEGDIDLWYHSENGQWLALEAPTEGGRVLRYEPVGLPRALRPDERLAFE